MGLLTEGTPLSWEETKKHADHVRYHGITQLLHIYHKLKTRENDCLKWGDEVEYMLVKFDHENKTAKLLLKSQPLLEELQKEELAHPGKNETSWKPEYASYMLEGTPGQPLGGCMRHFNRIEANMRLRREEVLKLLQSDEAVLSMTCFPRVGCPEFTFPSYTPSTTTGASHSLFFPQEAINVHPRYSTLTRNIRERRGHKVAINVPILKDANTPSPFIETFSNDDGEASKAAKPDHIYMDAMGFGMGCCCLQMTFQACNIDEARHLYDQLAVLTPVMHALSAAAPIFRGYLADVDCRWNVISAAVDDRTEEERGLVPLKNDRFKIRKSRYDSIDSYLSVQAAPYSDIKMAYDEETFQRLLKEGLDEQMARHFAHLYIRDPLTLFSEKIDLNDEEDSDHFENIQSTNWQTMRFKPPPANSPIGWRVEFRPTEVQLTDFENAAFATFVVLITRVILSFNLSFLIPLSKVDENLAFAQKRDAVRKEKFYFRRILKICPTTGGVKEDDEMCPMKCRYEPMTIDVIINGKEGEFSGLIPLINKFLDGVDVDFETRCTISQYLKFISKKASGEYLTTAQWMRQFVTEHADYKQDSVVNETVAYDLLKTCHEISNQGRKCPELFGNPQSRTSSSLNPECIKMMNGDAGSANSR